MVVKDKTMITKLCGAARGSKKEVIVIRGDRSAVASVASRVIKECAEAGDVIDLGAPREPRVSGRPRLCPCPLRPGPAESAQAARAQRKRRHLRRPAPPARPPPASPAPPAPPPPHARADERRLVVHLPTVACEKGKAKVVSSLHIMSSDECPEGSETRSAPSEYLAEFLSSIMRREYAEALRYCRLILQYEPHNCTARGFCALLEQKARAPPSASASPSPSPSPSPRPSASASASSSAPPTPPSSSDTPPPTTEQVEMEQEEDSLTSGASAASEGSDGGAGGAGEPSPYSSSLALESSSLEEEPPPPSLDGGGYSCCGSSEEHLEDYNNGNCAPRAPLDARTSHLRSEFAEDMQNDNALPRPRPNPRAALLLANSVCESEPDGGAQAQLRRLRAQFACSIK